MRTIKLLNKIAFAIILSFVLGHIFGVIGIFLAFSYFILYFFKPGFVPCLGCSAVGKTNNCPFCKIPASKKASRSPNSIKSLLLNTLLLVIISALSTGLVILEKNTLESFGEDSIKKTAYFSIEQHGHQHKLDEIFPVKFYVSGAQTSINTVQADMKFDPSRVQAVKIDINESIANIFVQKDINNSLGYVRIIGGLPNPGFSEENGVFATVYFKGVTPGVSEISFLPSSMVLANDGKGTNILKDYTSTSCIILPERLSEDEKEIQEGLISAVLGEETTRQNTLIFDTPENNVLAKSDLNLEMENISGESNSTPWFKKVLSVLHFVDNKILAFWSSIL